MARQPHHWFLLPLPAYKHYGGGTTPGPDPWLALTEQDVEAWRMRKIDERWCTEPGIARCLAWLEMTFCPRPAA